MSARVALPTPHLRLISNERQTVDRPLDTRDATQRRVRIAEVSRTAEQFRVDAVGEEDTQARLQRHRNELKIGHFLHVLWQFSTTIKCCRTPWGMSALALR